MRYPIGAEPADGGISFRVWAPDRRRVDVVVEGRTGPLALRSETGGYFSGVIAEAQAGSRYRYRLDGDEALPDPASRFQPEGPHGPSQVIDPGTYRWADAGWNGPVHEELVLYELHVGTFTHEGTWSAAAGELQALRDLGITVVELMPVADFAGSFGWGYDGVDLFAPTRLYGTPDEMRRFVDRAHELGLGVILDVVYNHLGPSGNVLARYARAFFTDRYANEWGQPIDFETEPAVRSFFVSNAGYWIDEFHLDGLRLDATQSIYDASPEHVLRAIARQVHESAHGRRTLLLGENEPQRIELIESCDLDALGNDDFHHAARVAVTGMREAYFTDYEGSAQELISAAKWGYLFQGQRYRWQGERRGTPALGVEPWRFVNCLQNHDQVANSPRGQRLHQLTSPGRLRAITAFHLLLPQTPLIFQGQEFAASAPFLYFADHEPALAEAVREGREAFACQFPSVAASRACLPDPGDPATFAASRLDPAERSAHGEAIALHRDLLALRRSEAAFRRSRTTLRSVDGAVLGQAALLLRYFGERSGDDRLLLLNLGADLDLDPAPEPLLAPPRGHRWRLRWSSGDPRYGGCGTQEPEREQGWWIPGEAALVLEPVAIGKESTP